MGYTVAFDSIPSLLLKITAVYLQKPVYRASLRMRLLPLML